MSDPVLICGGAGFIGTNVAARFCAAGKHVLLYDDLSRPGVDRNVQWLKATYGSLVDFERGDRSEARGLRPGEIRHALRSLIHDGELSRVRVADDEAIRDPVVRQAGWRE